MGRIIRNILLAFLGGFFLASFLFIVLNAGHLKNPFPPTLFGNLLFFLIFVGFIEEGAKFLAIKWGLGQYPYSYLLGLGFGAGETIVRGIPFIPWRIGAMGLHVITAGIIGYSIKKNKPVLGLVIAILFHTGFNLIVSN